MNNSIHRLGVCAMFLFSEVSAQGLIFQSPDKTSTISVSNANRIGNDWGGKHFDKLISIALSKNAGPCLWAGVSYQDETGFPPQVIWGRSSDVALFFYRPQRSEVILGVFRPNSALIYESVLTDADFKAWTAGMIVDPTHLKKIWTENWKEVEEGIYEGELAIAVSVVRRIYLRIDTIRFPSTVTVLHQKDS